MPLTFEEAHVVLGLIPGVPFTDIRTRFRKLALQHHPDRYKGDTSKMQAINNAYDVIASRFIRSDVPSQCINPHQGVADRPVLSPTDLIMASDFYRRLTVRRGHPNRQALSNLRVWINKMWNCKRFIKVFESEILEICNITYASHYADGQKPGWNTLWKPRSYLGLDVVNNTEIVDYGNVEYVVMLCALCIISDPLYKCMKYLAQYYWPTLDPFATMKSDHAIEMIGDMFELFLAAARADNVGPAFNFIEMNRDITVFCKAFHHLVAYLKTGYLKYKKERVPIVPGLQGDPWVSQWRDVFPTVETSSTIDASKALAALLSIGTA